MTGDLVRLSAARRALADADALPDVAQLVDYASAAAHAAKRAGLAEEAQRDWALFSLEAQRKAGQLLAEMPKRTNQHASSSVEPALWEVLGTKTSQEARHKAKRWQDVAAVPDAVWDDYTQRAQEPTRSRLLREARDHAAATQREQDRIEDVARLNATAATMDLRVGDFRTVLADVADVDAVICDPPYGRDAIDLYQDLAVWADRVLTPDGVLVVLTGQVWLPDIMRRLKHGRPYRWTAAYLTPGPGLVVHARRVSTNWKPLLVYGAGPRFSDVFTTAADDKTHHHWGQDFQAFTAIVERFTRPGHLVADPFLGGGTTAAACMATQRTFVGCDIDPVAVTSTRHRLNIDRDPQAGLTPTTPGGRPAPVSTPLPHRKAQPCPKPC